MNFITQSMACVLAAYALALGGCAGTPTSVPESEYSLMSCPQLEIEMAQSAEQKRAAGQMHEDAWKAIMPVAVAVRYSMAADSANAADQRIARLTGLQLKKSCNVATDYR